MKKRTKIIAGIFIGVAALSVAAAVAYSKAPFEVVLPQGFTLTAHTGCEGTEDNSLEAITKGYESHADIVEFDVRFLSDGTAILSHDETEMAGVTLFDALSLVKEYENLKVNLDMKTTDNLPAVLETVKELGLLERVFYTGIESKDVAAAKQQTPEITYFLNTDVSALKCKDRDYLSALADETENCGAIGINMSYKSCSKQLVEVFHERGLLVSVWTVNSKSAMRKVLPLGVDNITTRKPTELKKIIENK